MKSEVLITGGGGYIGSHVVKKFLKAGYKVFVLDNFSTGFRQALDNIKKYGELEVIEADLTDFEKVHQLFSQGPLKAAATVLHFAGALVVSESMRDPRKYFINNLAGSVNLLESMRSADIKNIIFSSTCAVYGDSQYVPIDEEHPLNPTNPYSESKLMVEKAIKWYADIFKLKYVIFRYFNVIGADPDSDVGYSSYPPTHLVPNAVRGALGLAPFKVTCANTFNTRDGTPVRDYVDVCDLADAHYMAMLYLEKGGESDIFNLGTGRGYSVYEIIDQVEKIVGKKLDRSPGEPRPGEYSESFANFGKASGKLGWKPAATLEESIRNLVRWFERYPNGYLGSKAP